MDQITRVVVSGGNSNCPAGIVLCAPAGNNMLQQSMASLLAHIGCFLHCLSIRCIHVGAALVHERVVMLAAHWWVLRVAVCRCRPGLAA